MGTGTQRCVWADKLVVSRLDRWSAQPELGFNENGAGHPTDENKRRHPAGEHRYYTTSISFVKRFVASLSRILR